jgi:diguanylate cyclase (GGDEF)-like protein
MTLRSRIVLLVLLATLTPAVLFGIFIFDGREADIAEARQSLGALASYAAEDLTSKVNGTVQLLYGLSRAPDLDVGDKTHKDACSAFLGEVLSRYPQYTGLLTIRPDGQLYCDSLRSGRTLDLNDRAYFRQARTSMEPAIEAVFGRLTGIAVLQIAYPARDKPGTLKYVLLASLNLAQFSSRFATASAHAAISVLIWDGKGTLLARFPDDGPRKLAGTVQADSALYGFVRAGKAVETAELPGPDGNVKIWARSILPDSASGGLRITLGIPREVLLAKADADLRRAVTTLVGATLLAFLCALLFAEFGIRRHVARIAAAAELQGKGNFGARIGAPYPRGELGGLMATLDTTAASVQAQQNELERNAEVLRRTNRTLTMLSAINSTIVRVHNRDELLAEACRIAAVEGQFPIVWAGILERGSLLVRPVAWQGVEQVYLDSVPRLVTDQTTLIGQAFASRQPIAVNDIAADARVTTRQAALGFGSRAFATFPLIVSGEPAGVLVLHSREAGFFDEQEMKLLGELAGDVAFALEYIEKSEKLDYLAYYDALTGLANRVLFHERLSEFLGRDATRGRNVALVLVDIERFRTINETFGRDVGDELLRQVARRGSRGFSDPRWLARIGADQFSSLNLDQAEPAGVVRSIERWHAEVFDEPFSLDGAELRASARYGIARFPRDGTDADTLFRNAEAALRKAKTGRERCLFYVPQMTERVAETLALENKLRLALVNDEFVLHYQPKVDLKTGRMAGVEALIRWESPELGLVPPMKFIPLLEETGLILQVGAWVLKRAAGDYREWREAGLNAPRVAVNVSPIQLRQRDFVQNLAQAISIGDAPAGIDLEITESLVMEDIEDNIRKLNEVRELGLSIAIDDFGTGHSSLSYLAKLPVQSLKIDRSFIIDMLSNPHTLTMVSTIISLAHALQLIVIAEGVDADDQARTLRLLRCDQMQGYLFSRPVPKEELVHLLQRND